MSCLFQYGKYKDVILYDLAPRWLSDRNVHHNGRKNAYFFSMEKRNILLEHMITKDIRNFKDKKTAKFATADQKEQLH